MRLQIGLCSEPLLTAVTFEGFLASVRTLVDSKTGFHATPIAALIA